VADPNTIDLQTLPSAFVPNHSNIPKLANDILEVASLMPEKVLGPVHVDQDSSALSSLDLERPNQGGNDSGHGQPRSTPANADQASAVYLLIVLPLLDLDVVVDEHETVRPRLPVHSP